MNDPKSITLAELQNAVSSAIAQIKSQKAVGLPDLANGPLLAGRIITWPSKEVMHPEAAASMKQAADHITDQVNSQIPGLKATSVVENAIGKIILGLIFRNE